VVQSESDHLIKSYQIGKLDRKIIQYNHIKTENNKEAQRKQLKHFVARLKGEQIFFTAEMFDYTDKNKK